jgi:ABC-2 type transport system ATP-binding protein
MITAQNLTKRFGSHTAVNDISFAIQPGVVTGFLGPNGAGKSTTMRMILGLDRPTSGSVTINGSSYETLAAPMRQVGALLDAKSVEGVRTARQHLTWLAVAGGIGRKRVDEVLELTGLTEVAGRRVGGFSLGMYQRLGIAAALLGDPEILLLDEPVNGLDPEGIRWVRNLMRRLTGEGRTVVVSSHLMSEMERTADHVLVIGGGRLIADMPMADFMKSGGIVSVDVVTPRADDLEQLLVQAGATVTRSPDRRESMQVTGVDNIGIAEMALKNRIPVHELTPKHDTLEARFMELTYDSVDFRSKEEPSA